jgi:Xaa-Pro aminopeptidase
MACFINFHWELAEARRVSGLEDWHGFFDPLPVVTERVLQAVPRRIGVLGLEHLPWISYRMLTADDSKRELVNLGSHFERLRRVKSALEICLLKSAVRITDEALTTVREMVRPGITEHEIAAQALQVFQTQGASSAFPPLVVAGTDVDSAVIARSARARPIEMGDTLMVDVGAAHQGYQADVARTMVLGPPSTLQQRIWDVVRQAYDSVVAMAGPGVPCYHLHQTAERIIQNAGFTLQHRIGHGIGLATSFEWPSLDSESALLEPGMTLAIEPAIYEVGAGAIKLEDSLVITEDGCEVVSQCPRDLALTISR